ncbi:AIM24 family protein [Bacillus cereus group sp. MYBK15-3]|uniref:AIM24 family protein n=1 Tax=unclassified Bacillus cereus group TaxID=2750818 RepID=UPI003F7A39C8
MSLPSFNDEKGILDKVALNDSTLQVREFDSSYIGDIQYATGIYHAQKLGMKLRRLEVELRGGELVFDGGMFQSSTGNIRFNRVKVNPMEIFRGVVRRANDESFFRPSVEGHGRVTLESSFRFIKLLRVATESKVVLEKGLYLASAGQFQFKTTKNLNLSYMMFANKSMFQTDVRGKGIIALELPVHPNELEKHEVHPNRPFRVDGDYVLYWVGDLKRTVRTSSTLFGSMVNGEGLVEEYSGSGYVVTAPTIGYYKTLSLGKDEGLQDTPNSGKHQRGGFLSRLLGNR